MPAGTDAILQIIGGGDGGDGLRGLRPDV